MLRVRNSFVLTISLVLGLGPAGSLAQDADREKILFLEQNLCANPQPQPKEQAAERNADTHGTVCLTCKLERDSVVDLQKIVKSLAEEARIKREVQFLRYYGEPAPTNLPKLIGKLTTELTVIKAEQYSLEKNIAKAKLEREAYLKNEITIGKVTVGRELSKEERRSLAELLKSVVPDSQDPQFQDTIDPQPLPPPSKESPLIEGPPDTKGPPPTSDSQFHSFTESIKPLKRFYEIIPLAKQVQVWLEKGDHQLPTGISREDIARALNLANSTKPGEYAQLEHYLKMLEASIPQAKANLEDVKKKQAEFIKSLPPGTYTQSDLTELENKFKDRVEKDSPGWKDCGLTVAESLAVYDYTHNGYQILNSALREGGARAEDLDHYTETLKAALKKFRTFDGAVRRGVWLPDEALKEHQEGAIVPYPAFTSTSVANGFQSRHRFTIKTKNGAYIAPYSRAPTEQEVIIPPGKFKVLSRQPGPNDTIEFVMQQMDD